MNEQVAAFKAKNQLVTEEINKLNVDFKSLNEELKQSQEEYSSKTEILNNKNLALTEKNEVKFILISLDTKIFPTNKICSQRKSNWIMKI